MCRVPGFEKLTKEKPLQLRLKGTINNDIQRTGKEAVSSVLHPPSTDSIILKENHGVH